MSTAAFRERLSYLRDEVPEGDEFFRRFFELCEDVERSFPESPWQQHLKDRLGGMLTLLGFDPHLPIPPHPENE